MYSFEWQEQEMCEDGAHCDVWLVKDGEYLCKADLADFDGDWQEEGPYREAEDSLLEKHGLTRDDISETIFPW